MSTKSILVTGGAGTLGQAVVKRLLRHADVDRVVVYSRDEASQARMASDPEFKTPRVEFVVGDILNKDALTRAVLKYQVTHIVHAAAQKHVPVAEKTPSECADVNIIGSRNVLQVAMEQGVKRVVMVSTDKAAQPSNVYGLSKALMERIAMEFEGVNGLSVNVTRFGNLVGSRGSVLELFLRQIQASGSVTLTDPNMTRYFIRVATAADTVLFALNTSASGLILIPDMRAAKMGEFVDAVFDFAHAPRNVQVIGPRPGEKTHEYIVGDDEWRRARLLSEFQGIALTNRVQPKPACAGPMSSDTAKYMNADEITGMIRETAKSVKEAV